MERAAIHVIRLQNDADKHCGQDHLTNASFRVPLLLCLRLIITYSLTIELQ